MSILEDEITDGRNQDDKTNMTEKVVAHINAQTRPDILV